MKFAKLLIEPFDSWNLEGGVSMNLSNAVGAHEEMVMSLFDSPDLSLFWCVSRSGTMSIGLRLVSLQGPWYGWSDRGRDLPGRRSSS